MDQILCERRSKPAVPTGLEEQREMMRIAGKAWRDAVGADEASPEGVAAPLDADEELHLPRPMPVSPLAVRAKLGLTRAAFAAAVRVPVETVAAWEQAHLVPDPAVQALLRILQRRQAEGTART